MDSKSDSNRSTLQAHRLPPELFDTICYEQEECDEIRRSDTKQNPS
jgi:hypothetical protein